MKNLTILGSTGSIGINTLSVVRANPNDFKVIALVADKNVDIMFQQCIEFIPHYVSMANKNAAKELYLRLKEAGIFNIKVTSDKNDACELVTLDNVDQVMSAIVGVAGLMPTMAAIKANKCVLLANKESLVTCGQLFMNALRESNAKLLPIDSEHNSIFRIMPKTIQNNLGFTTLREHNISHIVITGSGGPLYQLPVDNFATVTIDQACIHPNWSMGRKISVDSATMMNKGLEYIEAHWLFNASESEIEIIIHPQSIIHSMVRYFDGSVTAHLSTPDMRIPIAYAMYYPKSVNNNLEPLNFYKIGSLTFEQPDILRYPCLKLAIDASRAGQAATTVLNATNEIAVNAFLCGKIRFIDIASLNQEALLNLSFSEPKSIDEVLDIDYQSRKVAKLLCVKFQI
ncbi:1-deoxy-D-xylulose-5-phosphate reductoisomerase [Candidatus Profftia sp. (ex Adelges kitamiensis)]|uniref:1-deoxy-D-xylulose-5-phosphate reductoisomerase n=1 Tax=Candidatus Profftia sp. (ex Adelges kitamiensis) TaxID=2864218 RepID=UPI001CE37AAE|nr:1-deoxy-D-xylulose-5-phosphate reductoisomerase [Candidatus Profftia sp. (ex Adelges kitamiensis)]